MKTLEQQNKEFNRLSKSTKRVAIAKDALAQLNARKFKAVRNYYLQLSTSESQKIVQTEDAQCALQNATCGVCARGALLLSTVRKANTLKTNEIFGSFGGDHTRTYDIDCDLEEYEEKLWSAKQLAMIECAYEGWAAGRAGDLSSERVEELSNFCRGIRSPKRRLSKILRNIIKNKGKFVP